MQVLYTSIEDNFHLFESKKIFFLLLSAFVKNLSLTRFTISIRNYNINSFILCLVLQVNILLYFAINFAKNAKYSVKEKIWDN